MQRCSGVEPCDVRTWRKIVQTSLKRSSVWLDTVETCGKVLKGSAKEGTTVPRTRTE